MTAPAPVILIVGGDSRDVKTTTSALDRRFGSDYRVLTAGSAADGVAKLQGLAHHGEQVALVAADLHLPDGDGVEFLDRAAGLHKGVARILLFDLDEFATAPSNELPVRSAKDP
jgi:thioredoxin reductase (NADPH)